MTAIGTTAGVTLLIGALVLAGAVAATQQRRKYLAVIYKTLGATRGAFFAPSSSNSRCLVLPRRCLRPDRDGHDRLGACANGPSRWRSSSRPLRPRRPCFWRWLFVLGIGAIATWPCSRPRPRPISGGAERSEVATGVAKPCGSLGQPLYSRPEMPDLEQVTSLGERIPGQWQTSTDVTRKARPSAAPKRVWSTRASGPTCCASTITWRAVSRSPAWSLTSILRYAGWSSGGRPAAHAFGTFMFASAFKWVVIFAPLAMVFFLSARISSMSVSAAQIAFWIFAALMGRRSPRSSWSTPMRASPACSSLPRPSFGALSL